MQGVSWDDLRYVLAVVRFESIAEAARRLSVDETTVARRISRSERLLAARLFERSRGKLIPTEAGRQSAERAEHVEREVEALVAEISGADRAVSGRVRVTSVPIIVNRILIPALPALLDRQPDLHVELIAEPRDLSLTKREADIALRLGRPRSELRTVARRVGYLDYAIYEPKGRAGQQSGWITYDDMMADLPQARWIAEQIKAKNEGEASVRINDAEALLQAVASGLGKSLLPRVVADAAPGLSRVPVMSPPLRREIWLLVHPELRNLRRVEVVSRWLTETVGASGAPV
jgi:DNA-binding transcriptional LysR family regulator